MSDIGLAALVSALLSILLSFIQISSDSRIYNLESYFTGFLFFYIFIMIIGNILTTLFAANLIDNYITNKDFNLRGPVWIWYSLIGVFGFEAMIQKINVTFFDQGVLTINDWISRAKNSATAATLEKAADLDILFIQKQASQLQKKLTKEEIHTFATHNLGPAKYQEILSSITSNSNINPEHYLAHILANEVPKKVKALLKTHA